MLAEEMAELRGFMHRNGIMFCYSGFLTEDVLGGIGSALRKKLAIEDADRNVAKGLFGIFVELVQNVIRYSSEREIKENEEEILDLRYGVLSVGKSGERYYVACGNLINVDDMERLSTNLAHIKSLDRGELKALYKETLRGEVPATSKGAGVGFIDIARRASDGFEYDFVETNDGKAFFTMKAYL